MCSQVAKTLTRLCECVSWFGSLLCVYRKMLFSPHIIFNLNTLLLNTTCPVLANSADPDHLASEEAN